VTHLLEPLSHLPTDDSLQCDVQTTNDEDNTTKNKLPVWRINGLFHKAHRWQLAGRVYTVERLAAGRLAGLLKAIASNPNHSLYQILPPFRPNQYSLLKRGHPFQLPIINTTLLKSTVGLINKCLFQFA